MNQVIFDPLPESLAGSLAGTWCDSKQEYCSDAFEDLVSLISTEALKIDSQEVVVNPMVIIMLERATCGHFEGVSWRHMVNGSHIGYIGEIQVFINIYLDDTKPIVIVSGDPDLENTEIVLKNICFH